MGRKTWDSLPGPLPGRVSIALSRQARPIYATLPNYKQLTWKSPDFHHKKLTFHFETQVEYFF